MRDLQIFNSSEFGVLRTFIEPDGSVLYCLTDAARMLGYTNPQHSVKKFCRGGSKRSITLNCGIKADGSPISRKQEMIFGPQGDIYRLIVRASDQSVNPEIKERAERFGSWIFDEILPAIAHDGAYLTNRADPAALRQKADELESVTVINDTARILLPVLQEAGMKPAFQALTMRQIYRKAGIDLPVDDIRAERELYDIGTIAKKVGIFSATGKPHEKAVSAIIRSIDIPENEKELVSFERNGHMGTTYQFAAPVVDRVQNWLVEHNCPATITGIRSGKPCTYKVQYTSEGGANHA